MNKKKQNSDSGEEYRLVYSTDSVKARESGSQAETSFSGELKPALRIERKGRGGKRVTILFKLPAHHSLLQDLCAYLKRSLGSGGSFEIADGEGVIEIQGDRREQIPALISSYSAKKK